MKLDFIRETYMGAVIGKKRQHLSNIEKKTGATLRVYRKDSNSSLYIKGSIESQKKAIREIKEIVVRLMHLDRFEKIFLIITKSFW